MDSDYYKETFDINWADETNSETLTLDKLNNDNFTLLQVNIEDAFNRSGASYALEVFSETGGINAIGDRLENAKKHYMSGEPMDYPIIEYNMISEEVAFTNGRHRTLAAAHMGCKYIPMLVYNEYLDDFKSNLRTKSMEEPLEKARYVDEAEGKLKLNWANENESTDQIKQVFKNDSHVLLQVNVEKAFANLMDYDLEENLYFKLGRPKSLTEEVEEAKNKFLNQELTDFPTIASNKEFDSVKLTSGKETIMAAYDLGCKFVPMLVDKEDLSHFQSIVETKGMDQRLESPEVEPELKNKTNRNTKKIM